MSNAKEGSHIATDLAESSTSRSRIRPVLRFARLQVIVSPGRFTPSRSSKAVTYALLALVALGTGLRGAALFSERNLWIDEAMLALNLISRTPAQLFQPLDWNQGAPVGFLLLAKLSVSLTGTSEIGLRLVPFLGSVTGLALFAGSVRQFLSVPAALLATALFACSPSLVSYAGECKQYATDAAITATLFAVAAPLFRTGIHFGTWFMLAGAGAIAVWFSHPAAFVLGGIGGALFLEAILAHNRMRLTAVSVTIACWLASFALCYFICLRHLSANSYLIHYWTDHFLPLPPRSLGDCGWLLDHTLHFFDFPCWFGRPGARTSVLAAGFFSVGLFGFWRACRPLALALIITAGLTLLASALHRYPFAGRLLLFLVPLAILSVAQGVSMLTAPLRRRSRRLAGVLMAALVLPSLLELAQELRRPERAEQIEPLIETIRQHWQPDDRLFVYYGAIPAFEYYTRANPFPETAIIRGKESRSHREVYRDQLAPLKRQARVWLLFSHRHRDEEAVLCHYAESIGSCSRTVLTEGAALYLFDFSASPVASW